MNQTNSDDNDSYFSNYENNKDIIWPTLMGIFVALALGWMICRYKCSSSQEQSPNLVQCCPNSLCQSFCLCFTFFFNLCLCCINNRQQQQTNIDLTITNNRERLSNASLINQQSTSVFLMNNKRFSIPLATVRSTEPKQHPLRRDSLLPSVENMYEEGNQSSWPFQTIDIGFHEQINEIKKKSIFYNI